MLQQLFIMLVHIVVKEILFTILKCRDHNGTGRSHLEQPRTVAGEEAAQSVAAINRYQATVGGLFVQFLGRRIGKDDTFAELDLLMRFDHIEGAGDKRSYRAGQHARHKIKAKRRLLAVFAERHLNVLVEGPIYAREGHVPQYGRWQATPQRRNALQGNHIAHESHHLAIAQSLRLHFGAHQLDGTDKGHGAYACRDAGEHGHHQRQIVLTNFALLGGPKVSLVHFHIAHLELIVRNEIDNGRGQRRDERRSQPGPQCADALVVAYLDQCVQCAGELWPTFRRGTHWEQMIHQSVAVEETLVRVRLLRLHARFDDIQRGHRAGRYDGSGAGRCHLLHWPYLKARIIKDFSYFLGLRFNRIAGDGIRRRFAIVNIRCSVCVAKFACRHLCCTGTLPDSWARNRFKLGVFLLKKKINIYILFYRKRTDVSNSSLFGYFLAMTAVLQTVATLCSIYLPPLGNTERRGIWF